MFRLRIVAAAVLTVALSGTTEAAPSAPQRDGRDGLRIEWTREAAAIPGNPQASARAYIEDHADELGIGETLHDLVFVDARESLVGTHVRFRQEIDGIPVAGADVIVTVSADGDVLRVFNNSYPVSTPPTATKTRISGDDALDVAWNHLRVHGAVFSAPSTLLVYLPQDDTFRLAYRVHVSTHAPRGDWRHTIDAASGDVIAVEDLRLMKIPRQERTLSDFSSLFASYDGEVLDRSFALAEFRTSEVRLGVLPAPAATADGTALVFDPDPRTTLMDDGLQDSSSASSFTPTYVTRTLRDLSLQGGTYSLEGPYVQIVDWDAPSDAPSTTSDGNWTATRGNNDFNDVMTYYHIDSSQRYLQSLGFTGAKAIQSGSIVVDSNGEDGDDNSVYYGGVNRISYGHGGVDDNEDADVILHEYWHAMQHDINGSWAGGDTGAMGEGFGDYWAASYSYGTSNGPAYHPTWAFTWDGHNSYWGGRDLDEFDTRYDPTKSYPAHTVVNGDNGDELWGTPVFQAFLELVGRGVPREEVDTIVVESQFGLGAGLTMREMAQNMVQTARTLYPYGPHAGVFADTFVHHEILDPSLHVSAPTLSAEPVATPGTSNQLAWTGGTLPAAKRSTASIAHVKVVNVLRAARPRAAVGDLTGSALQAKTATPLSGVVHASKGPVVTAGWAPILADGFESGWPGSWQTSGNYTTEGEPITWGRTAYTANAGTYSAGSQCAVIDPAASWPFTPATSPPDLECWLWYGPFDLSDASDARVVFSSWHDLGAGDSFSWMASINDVDYYGSTLTGGSAGWTQRTLDLTSIPTLGNLCGQSTVYVAFRAIWDTTQDFVDGPFVDDVLIEKYTSADLADLEVQSMTVPASVQEFGFASVTVQVHNAGAAVAGSSYVDLYLSPLNDTDTSDDTRVAERTVPALAVSASTTVQASFRLPNLKTGDYSAWVLAKVDSRGNIPESDESNNLYKHAAGMSVTGATVLYRCLCDDDPTFGSSSNSGWTAQQQFQFEGLLPGTQYWYRVKAGAGPVTNMVESEWSNRESSTQNLPNGTPVWWMEQNGLTNGSLISLELSDGDSDGMQAWEEWRAYTDPTNASSVLTLTDSAASGDTRTVWWQSVTGPTYRVLYGTNACGPYSPVATGLVPTPPLNVWTDTTASAEMNVYRIGVEP